LSKSKHIYAQFSITRIKRCVHLSWRVDHLDFSDMNPHWLLASLGLTLETDRRISQLGDNTATILPDDAPKHGAPAAADSLK
jgi:hypothetical protein